MSDRAKLIKEKENILSALKEDSLNPQLHYALGLVHLCLGDILIANAELRTAEALGYSSEEVKRKIGMIYRQFNLNPNLKGKLLSEQNLRFFRNNLEHNQYFRINILKEFITTLGSKDKLSLMDIGGGDGKLAFFMPNAKYCLVEPSINGISGVGLPFDDDAFDVIIACYVLEHIPKKQRDLFLDQLCSKAKRDVILLNPFSIEGTQERERTKLIYELTGADWAREHMELGLPTIDYVKKYAQSRGYPLKIVPSGTFSTSFAFTLLQHYAMKAGCAEELKRISSFFNEKLSNVLDSEKYPTAYLVHFDLSAFR